MRITVPALRWKTIVKLAALTLFIIAANFIAREITSALSLEIRPSTEDFVHRLIMASAAGYALLIAIPFVPGVEIGLAIIGVLGPQIVPLVYLCTLAGLIMSFLLGRMIPLRALSTLFEELRLVRISALLRSLEPLDRESRLAFLIQRAPKRLVPTLLRHRYLALAIAINLPGNILIGGGGGIAMSAGISGLYNTAGYILTVSIAVAPVPIAILLLGKGVLSL